MGKNINYYLMEDSIDGAIKCSSLSLSLVAYKIPLASMMAYIDLEELNKAGIYILYNSETYECYVGQANTRCNGKSGIIKRVQEHSEEKFWDTALIFVTSNTSMGASNISYIESYLIEYIRDNTSYLIKNVNMPSKGSVTIEEEAEILNIIDIIKIYVNILGFKVPNIFKRNEYNNKNIDLHKEHVAYPSIDNNKDSNIIIKNKGQLDNASSYKSTPVSISTDIVERRRQSSNVAKALSNYRELQEKLLTLHGYDCTALALIGDNNLVILLSGSYISRAPFDKTKYNKYIDEGYITQNGILLKDIRLTIEQATKLVAGEYYTNDIKWESCTVYNIKEISKILRME